ncbi:MAG: hypothetical protein M2R45_05341 [Verrucomicrobia subdivision 3 bacterium]|nr:hypothetical protein [Limisphaerales bacterium]MCS1417836.1 hypothetical protein [Limisphaerales bacterium]
MVNLSTLVLLETKMRGTTVDMGHAKGGDQHAISTGIHLSSHQRTPARTMCPDRGMRTST